MGGDSASPHKLRTLQDVRAHLLKLPPERQTNVGWQGLSPGGSGEMHDEPWAGVGRKLANAAFHMERMGRSIAPPEQTHYSVVQESAGAVIDTGWQRSFYAYFDAFLSATRSVPEVVKCCFGHDSYPGLKSWFNGLSDSEKCRRDEFTAKFKSVYLRFQKHILGTARHGSEHRRGYAPVEVVITGRFGALYVGSPVKGVPVSETRQVVDPNVPFLARSIPVRPTWTGFTTKGRPLFEICREYFDEAAKLVDESRSISAQVHKDNTLSNPPWQ